ncbi:FkbM family methyltransferase [Armatimonas sp.]|uniref:FkbM family methyltransferase n=1 Tax=Armatimonas sp. TaxID=1872638 RepID=UPI0037538833
MKSILRRIKSVPILGDCLVTMKAKITGKWKEDPSYWLGLVVRTQQAQVVQIGSNDGTSNDPIHQLLAKNQQWKALLVEPVPFVFERLKKNYGTSSRFAFENLAVGEDESLDFYWVSQEAKVKFPTIPYWYDQVGSFSKDHVLHHFSEFEIEPFIISENIKIISFSGLIERNKINKIDILHIDTEGHDYKVLDMVDFVKIQPTCILFEFKHLSYEERIASDNLLSPFYDLFLIGDDVIAVHKSLPQSLRSRFNILSAPVLRESVA